jgi:hypothetical protein
MFDFLRELWDSEWHPVTKPAFVLSILFYLSFLLYAFRSHEGFLLIDNVNLVVHEGGHLLFSWLGPTMCLWGGTLFQWLVPFFLAIYFFTQRATSGYVFSLFFFFENWLYTATYMADARAQVLPLVTVGDPDQAGHDWFLIFSNLSVLQHDTSIAAVIRFLGWTGMIACVAWLAYRYSQDRRRADQASPLIPMA